MTLLQRRAETQGQRVENLYVIVSLFIGFFTQGCLSDHDEAAEEGAARDLLASGGVELDGAIAGPDALHRDFCVRYEAVGAERVLVHHLETQDGELRGHHVELVHSLPLGVESVVWHHRRLLGARVPRHTRHLEHYVRIDDVLIRLCRLCRVR